MPLGTLIVSAYDRSAGAVAGPSVGGLKLSVGFNDASGPTTLNVTLSTCDAACVMRSTICALSESVAPWTVSLPPVYSAIWV